MPISSASRRKPAALAKSCISGWSTGNSRSIALVNAPACTARIPITPTSLARAAAIMARGFAGPRKNFSPPGESSRLAMHCTAAGAGRSLSRLMMMSGWPMPVAPSGLVAETRRRRKASRDLTDSLRERTGNHALEIVAEAEELPPPPPLSPTWLMSSVLPVARCQGVVHDEIGNVTAQSLTGRKVKEEMLASKDATQCCFLRRSREARERANHSGHHLGSHAEFEMVFAKEGSQYLRPRCADDRVSAWVGRVRGCVADLGKPIGIGLGFRVAVRRGRADRGHRPPEIVSVFRVVKCDHGIGKTQIEQRKQPSVLRSRQVMRQRRRLSDLVPVVLNCPVPKTAS